MTDDHATRTAAPKLRLHRPAYWTTSVREACDAMEAACDRAGLCPDEAAVSAARLAEDEFGQAWLQMDRAASPEVYVSEQLGSLSCQTAAPDVEGLRALLAKATPGPWMQREDCSGYIDAPHVCPPGAHARAYALGDAALIVAAVNALPGLLDAISSSAQTDEGLRETASANRCDFCRKDFGAARRIVTNEEVAICDECIRLCVACLYDKADTPSTAEIAAAIRDGTFLDKVAPQYRPSSYRTPKERAAALARPAPPETAKGWRLVPAEPLPEMLGAFWRVKNGHHFHDEPPPADTSDYAAYRAMLAAAPRPDTDRGEQAAKSVSGLRTEVALIIEGVIEDLNEGDDVSNVEVADRILALVAPTIALAPTEPRETATPDVERIVAWRWKYADSPRMRWTLSDTEVIGRDTICEPLYGAPASTRPDEHAAKSVEGLWEAASFLLDRLSDAEPGMPEGEYFRQYSGHIDPAIARLRAALAPTEPRKTTPAADAYEPLSCFICKEPFEPGEMVLPDVNEGLGHRACFGDDRASFVDLETGDSLPEDEPLPTGWPWEEESASRATTPTPEAGAEPLVFAYTNHRGETSVRRATPISVRYGSTEWHTAPQWLLRAFDVDKQAEREFAMDDMVSPTVPADAALARPEPPETAEGWRPIESAPPPAKLPFDAVVEHRSFGRTNRRIERSCRKAEDVITSRTGNELVWDYVEKEDGSTTTSRVTHWASILNDLPAAPRPVAAEGRGCARGAAEASEALPSDVCAPYPCEQKATPAPQQRTEQDGYSERQRAALWRASALLSMLRNLCGFEQDGSSRDICLRQEAGGVWVVSVGDELAACGDSMESALEEAYHDWRSS